MDCARDGFSATISTLTGILGDHRTLLPVAISNKQRQQLLLPPYRPRMICRSDQTQRSRHIGIRMMKMRRWLDL
jgi:hypothetical protein